MEQFLKYEGEKFEKGSVTNVSDLLAIEMPLEISVNGKPFSVVMQTPGAEVSLALGLLFAEDVISNEVVFQSVCTNGEKGNIEKINIQVDKKILGDGLKNSRSLLSASSCGICGKQELDQIHVKGKKINSKHRVPADTIIAAQNKMFNAQQVFNKTGGCHGIAIFNKKGELLSINEDVGRHNALDKCIGDLIQSDNLKHAEIISCSGRISFEIVSKAFRAKCPIIVAVSAPTSLAVDFAKEFGLTLLAFGRKNKFTCYANPWRIS